MRRTATVVLILWAFVTVLSASAQAAVSIPKPEKTFSAKGGSATASFTVAGGEPAEVAAAVVEGGSWIHLDPRSLTQVVKLSAKGTGRGKVRYTVDPCPTWLAEARRGRLSIGGEELTVIQGGLPCKLSLRPRRLAFPEQGGTGTIEVTATAGCPWTAQVDDDADWITLDGGASGVGSGAVSYSLRATGSDGKRAGSVTLITGAAKPVAKKHSVSQAAASGEPPPPVSDPRTTLLDVNDPSGRDLDFSSGRLGPAGADLSLWGVFYEQWFLPDLEGNVRDAGTTDWKAAGTAPDGEYPRVTVTPQTGEVYFVKTAEGKYAKFKVRRYGMPGNLILDWVYQPNGSRTMPVDENPPRIVSVTPAEGATGVRLTADFRIRFSEPLDPASLVLTAPSLAGPYNPAFPLSPFLDAAADAIVWPLGQSLAPEAQYTVRLSPWESSPSRVADLSGNVLDLDKVWSFATAAAPALPGTLLFGQYFADEIWLADAGGTRATPVSVPGLAEEGEALVGRRLLPGGTKVVFCTFGVSTDASIKLFDLRTGELTVVAAGVSLPLPGVNYDVSPSGDRVLYSTLTPAATYVYTIATGTTVKIADVYAAGLNWCKAAGSERVAFNNVATGRLSVLDAATGAVTDLWAGTAFGPVWSPDGSRLVFQRYAASAGSFLYLLGAEGGEPRRLTAATAGEESEPTWSRDGTRIAFTRDGTLHVIEADGTGERTLADSSFESRTQYGPTWSPDDAWIAYYGRHDDVYDNFYFDLCAVKADGTGGETKLTNTGDSREPIWFSAPAGEQPPPRLVSASIGEGASDVPWRADLFALTVTFDRLMNHRETEWALTLEPQPSDYPQFPSISWSGKSLTLTVGNSLKPSTAYTARIRGRAADAFGLGLDADGNGVAEGSPADDWILHFTTAPGP